MTRCLEIRIKDSDEPLWIYEDDLAGGDGPIMPEPYHDAATLGLGLSYAHLCDDGMIRRFMQVIGTRDDIMVVGEA